MKSELHLKAMRATAVVATGLALTVGGAALAGAAAGVATTTVNIRSGPGTSHSIEGRLVRGQRVEVMRKPKDGWVQVRFAGSTAYMAARYVHTAGSLPAVPDKISTSGTKVVTASLNVRSGPSSGYRVVGRLPEGSRITLAGKQRGGFAKTRFGGQLRWVSVAYLARAHGGAADRGPGRSGKIPFGSAAKGKAALAFAKRQLGKSYEFGAEGPHRYDCSGLMLAAWKSVGVWMPRTAHEQYAEGHKIAKSELRAGDLVFFYSQRPRHVGMYVKNGKIIDSPRPGKVVRYTTIGYMPYSGAVRPR